MLFISNDDVRKVLDMGATLDALERVYREMAIGDAVGMGRIDLYVPSDKPVAPYYRWAVMTGGSRKDGFVCARMLSDMVNWPRQHGHLRETKYAGAPGTFCGLLFLFSIEDATPVAMINDGVLQHLSTSSPAPTRAGATRERPRCSSMSAPSVPNSKPSLRWSIGARANKDWAARFRANGFCKTCGIEGVRIAATAVYLLPSLTLFPTCSWSFDLEGACSSLRCAAKADAR